MKVVKFVLIAFLLAAAGVVFMQVLEKTNDYGDIVRIEDLELPCDTSGIIHYEGFAITYNEDHEQANWVAYELTKKNIGGKVKRCDCFQEDTRISSGTATLEDYKKSGFDRGHLAPSGDMKSSEKVNRESFYFSNISPQLAGFNRGIWRDLEEEVRVWAKKHGSVYVITGPILKKRLKTIGANEVSVPKQFFKAVLCYNSGNVEAIGFLIPNKETNKSIFSFAMDIDQLESHTGLDLFCKLPVDIEQDIESDYDRSFWE